jgi:hypothetical protein
VFESISSFKDPMLAMMNYSSNSQIENSKYNYLTLQASNFCSSIDQSMTPSLSPSPPSTPLNATVDHPRGRHRYVQLHLRPKVTVRSPSQVRLRRTNQRTTTSSPSRPPLPARDAIEVSSQNP